MLLLLFMSGNQDLRAKDPVTPAVHSTVLDQLPNEYPELKHQFYVLESQLLDRPRRKALEPITPVIPDANDR